VRTLIREGISAFGLIAHRPMFREHEDMSMELTLDVTHYRELTLVFLEGVASRSPPRSAMCDKFLLVWWFCTTGGDCVSLDSSCVLLWKDTSLAKREC
jgi:hypothetical protein